MTAAVSALYRKAGSLAVAQVIGMVVPLVTVPYLARVLGPEGWGPVVAAQGLGNWLLLVLEFGFELSGTRDVARARLDESELRAVVNGVQSAKAILVALLVPIVALTLWLVPMMREWTDLVAWSIVFAVLRGYSPLWFYQGVERQGLAAYVDMGSRALAALGVLFVVHGPDDGVRVLQLQAAFAGLSLLLLTWGMRREVPVRLFSARAGIATLRGGSSMFAMRASSGLYIQANALILSALAGPATVAFFGGAERIVRAAINLLQPLTQVFLPRVSFLRASDPAAARTLVRQTLWTVGGFGLVMGVAAMVGAPWLVRIILGPGYDAAIPVLRIFGLLPILVSITTVIGLYWALPFGRDRLMLGAVVLAGATNVALAMLLVPRWSASGMAASAVIAELVILVIIGMAYRRAESPDE
jgi:PST family polysaccharide transporter